MTSLLCFTCISPKMFHRNICVLYYYYEFSENAVNGEFLLCNFFSCCGHDNHSHPHRQQRFLLALLIRIFALVFQWSPQINDTSKTFHRNICAPYYCQICRMECVIYFPAAVSNYLSPHTTNNQILCTCRSMRPPHHTLIALEGFFRFPIHHCLVLRQT